MFLDGQNGKAFSNNFFGRPKEILRPADLNPFLSGQAIAIPLSGSFHTYWNNVHLLMITEQISAYESRFDAIISNLGGLLVPSRTKKNCWFVVSWEDQSDG